MLIALFSQKITKKSRALNADKIKCVTRGTELIKRNVALTNISFIKKLHRNISS